MNLKKSTKRNFADYLKASTGNSHALSFRNDFREIVFRFKNENDALNVRGVFESVLKNLGYKYGSVKYEERKHLGIGFSVNYFNDAYSVSFTGYEQNADRSFFAQLNKEFTPIQKLIKNA